MKKVIFVHLYNDRSGSPKVLSQVIAALRDIGVFTEVITSKHDFGFLNDVADVQKTLFYKRSENKYVTLFYYFISQLLLFFISLRYLRQDVIFYVNTMMPIGASVAAKLTGKPVYYHVQETSLKPRVFKSFLRLVIKMTAQKVIFVSKYLCDTEGFRGLEQFVVYNALDNKFRPQQCDNYVRERGADDAFNSLMICSLKHYKGVPELIKVAEALVASPRFRFTLVLNASPEEIEEYFRGVAIPVNMTLYPRQVDVTPFYVDADVVLNLSRPDEWIETFGLTILEAMSYGVPVLVPPIGGPSEVVRNGEDGFLISCYDTDAIVQTLSRLSIDFLAYSRLAANALKRSADFDETSFRQALYTILKPELGN